MFKKLIFFSFFVVASFILAAQQANIHLLDLGIVPVIETGQTQPADVKMKVSFKIDHPELGQTVFSDFGTTQGGNDIASFTAQIVPDGSGYGISYNGVTYSIGTNYQAKFVITLTQQQYHDYNFISLKVNDNTGLYSNILNLGSN
ncbi:MAG: hypothetical protein J7L46_02925 [Bacteroidales bacterium]|nr:hypothetical protein [Bacteroidales bacterium]